MHTYTIDGTTYYALNDALWIVDGEPVDGRNLDERKTYLYDGELIRVDVPSMNWKNPKIKFWKRGEDSDFSDYEPVDEFGPVRRVTRAVPDDVNECEACGGWAGNKDLCFDCEYRE